MAVRRTPRGFIVPDGKELVKDMDNHVGHNADLAERLHAETFARVAQIELAAGFDPSLTVADDVVAPLMADRGTATGAALGDGVEAFLRDTGSGAYRAVSDGVGEFGSPLNAAVRAQVAKTVRTSAGVGVSVGGTRVTPGVDARYAAFPGACLLADGRILLMWREGTDHVNAKDGVFRASTSTDGGLTWSGAVTSLTMPGFDLRDPSVSTSPDRSVVYLTYFKGTAANVAAGCFIRRSTDQGVTWGAEVRVDPNQPYAAICSPVVTLPDGKLLATWYGKTLSGDAWESVFTATSTDGGLSWSAPVKRVDGVAAGMHMQEPWAAVSGDDVVIMHRRGNASKIGLLRSANGGATFGASVDCFSGTGRPGFVITANRTIVCVYRNYPGAMAEQHGVMRYSRDMGVNWSQPALVERANPIWWTYSAPLEVSPGQIFCPTTVEATSTSSRLTIRYLTEGGAASPFGDTPLRGVEKVVDRANSLAVVDDFDRPNGAIGVSVNGHQWSSSGGASIVDGALKDTTGNLAAGNRHTINALTGDVDITAEILWTGNPGIYIIYRYVDASNFCFAGIETSGTFGRIYKMVAGVATQIATSATGAVSAPAGPYHVMRVSAIGDNHRLYFEDALVASGSDPVNKTAQLVGLRTGSGNGTTNHQIRSFVATRRSGIAS